MRRCSAMIKMFVKRTIAFVNSLLVVLTGRVSIPLLVSYPDPKPHAPINRLSHACLNMWVEFDISVTLVHY